jgi:hypothetical protein
MNAQMKEIAARRDYLVDRSEWEREQAAICTENIARLFSKDNLGRAVKSSAGSVAGFFILRWVGKKLAGTVGKFFGRFVTGLWRR